MFLIFTLLACSPHYTPEQLEQNAELERQFTTACLEYVGANAIINNRDAPCPAVFPSCHTMSLDELSARMKDRLNEMHAIVSQRDALGFTETDINGRPTAWKCHINGSGPPVTMRLSLPDPEPASAELPQ